MKTVFVDTSGFYALLDPTDSFHEAARACFERAFAEGWELATTNYVVHETWAVIQSRLGWNALSAWTNRVLRHCLVIWVDETLHRVGAARCSQARERRLSLTDCVSLEWMQARAVREAIAQDEPFAREGIRLPLD